MGVITEALRIAKESAVGSKEARREPSPRGRFAFPPGHARPINQRADMMSLSGSLGVVFRRRWTVLMIFTLVFGASALATYSMTPIYESTALLLVKLGREFQNAPEGGELFATPVSQVVKTEIAILRTDSVIRSVVEAVGPATLYPALLEAEGNPRRPAQTGAVGVAAGAGSPNLMGLASLRFSGNLRVEGVPETQVIRVTFAHPDPELAANALNLLVDRFMERHLWVFGESKATAFLEKKVEGDRRKLELADEKIRAFMEKHEGFAIVDIENFAARERRKLSSEQSSLRGDIAAHRQELATLAQDRGSTSKYAANGPEDLDERLLKLRAELESLEVREASVRRQIAQYDEELAALPALRKQYDRLGRQRAAAATVYETSSTKLEAALVSQEMDLQKIANISVLQAGQVPAEPVRPRKSLYLAIGFVVAGGLAVLSALLLEARRPRFA